LQGLLRRNVESCPGGIGGCSNPIGDRALGIGELEHTSEGGGICTMLHIETRARTAILAAGLRLPSVFLLLSTYPVIHQSPSPRTRPLPTASRRAVQTAGSITGTTTGRTTDPTIAPATGRAVPPEAGRATRPIVLPLAGQTAVPIARGTAGLAIGRAVRPVAYRTAGPANQPTTGRTTDLTAGQGIGRTIEPTTDLTMGGTTPGRVFGNLRDRFGPIREIAAHRQITP
jgi:hypothetical protein